MKTDFSFLIQLNQNIRTLDTIEECIKVIFGPTGKNGMVSNKKDNLKLLTNGSLLLKSLDFNNPVENILLKLLEQAASKTFLISGDGSTTTSLLCCYLLKNSFPFLISGYNPIFLSNGFKKISYFLNEKILEFSTPVTKKEELVGMIKTSLGKKVKKDVFHLLENTIEQQILHRDGLILVEENICSENQLEIIQGIELERGFLSSYFVNNLTTFEVNYDNSYILITTNPIHSLNQLQGVIEHLQTTNSPLVIITEEIQKDVLSALILNTIKKKLKIVVVKYAAIKFIKNGLLEDLALLTHSIFTTNKSSSPRTSNEETQNAPKVDGNFQSEHIFQVQELGKVEKVIITKDKSTFLISKFSKVLIERQINDLNRELLNSESEYEKNIFKMRIARLSGTILKIKLAISNQYEFDELRQKVENTISTLKAGLEEGFIPGGGCFLHNISDELLNWGYLNLVGEEIFSSQIISKALRKPQEELLENLFFNQTKASVKLKLQTLGYPYTFDLLEEKIVNTLTSSLLDSTKSLRGSIWNSITLSSTIITS